MENSDTFEYMIDDNEWRYDELHDDCNNNDNKQYKDGDDEENYNDAKYMIEFRRRRWLTLRKTTKTKPMIKTMTA